MNEFFDPTGNNQRKEEIKQIINTFAQQENSYIYAIKFICESKSDYTKIYCFSILHNFIIKNWCSLTDQVKNELKDYILTNLIKLHLEGNHSLFIQNKLCQMIATIVRLSYPNFWSSYFDDVASLILSSGATTELGIRLLNITLEELLACSSDDLDEQRKIELTKLISNQVPLIVNVLTSILSSISAKYLGGYLHFVTPPSTPPSNQMVDCNQEIDDHLIISTTSNKQINLKSICLSIKSLLDNIDTNSLDILQLTLRCNLTLLQWLPINEFYPLLNESMLELLFIFATFGCSNGSKETSIGILSITCLNELLMKNYVYSEFSSKFYLTSFEAIFKVLQIIDTEFDLKSIDDDYLMKFIDSMRYFVTNQIVYRGDEMMNKFFFNFLEKLFHLTFKLKFTAHYQQFIEIWLNLLDIYINYNGKNSCLNINNNLIHNRWINDADDVNSIDTKLGIASIELTKQVLIKLQFRFNYAQLEELDAEDLNDFGQSEKQIYFNCNVELLSKITQLIPKQAIEIVNGFFEELVKIFLNMDQLLGQSFSSDSKRIVTEYLSIEDANNLDYALKDFVTLLNVWQRLSEHFIDGKFKLNLPIVQNLLDQVMTTLDYSNRLKLFTFNCDKQAIVQDLSELHQSALLLLKFYNAMDRSIFK